MRTRGRGAAGEEERAMEIRDEEMTIWSIRINYLDVQTPTLKFSWLAKI